MGPILSLRHKDNTVNTDIVVDFESARPSPEEESVYATADAVLSQASGLLDTLRNYSGQGAAISKAISECTKEAEEAAWAAVIPQVQILNDFYQFSTKLEEVLPQLLKELCAGDVIANLEKKQALTRQFAEMLHFVLIFDDVKMTTPAIQNDFSYYRRTLSRLKMSDQASTEMKNLVVRDELANFMSLFYAYPTPMLNSVTTSTTKFVNEVVSSIPSENVTECLATMAAVCHNAVHSPEQRAKFQKPETGLFCLRVMVGLIILYDHLHPNGAFCKTSAINIRSSIRLIRELGEENKDGLLNALRYTTKHLNDDDTPKQIKQLLA